MANIVTKIDEVGTYFVGQNDIIIFEAPTSYSSATLESLLIDPKSLGNILLDSTAMTGDAASITPVKNERGETFVSLTEEGTFGVEFFVPSTSQAMVEALLKADVITTTIAAGGVLPSTAVVAGFMHKPTISQMPLMIVNADRTCALLIPKAKFVASFGIEEKIYGINLSIQAEQINTTELKTVMIIWGDIAE